MKNKGKVRITVVDLNPPERLRKALKQLTLEHLRKRKK